MSRKYRDLYDETVGKLKAIPENEEEVILFKLAKIEEDSEKLAKLDELISAISKKSRGGAPRKTAGDQELARALAEKHGGNIKSARQDFAKFVSRRDKITIKRARERFDKVTKA